MARPSKINKVEIKWNNLLPFRNYLAITIFGKMNIRNKNKTRWEKYYDDERKNTVLNHEMVHVLQARSTNDNWFEFYILYIWYWFICFIVTFNQRLSYKTNPFELEAYAEEKNMKYTESCWRKYILSIKERKEIYKCKFKKV